MDGRQKLGQNGHRPAHLMIIGTSELLFVYGTLMRGEPAHHYLERAERLGTHVTEAAFRLVVVDWYPVMAPGGTQAVHGEVYRIELSDLRQIDAYEGDEYQRQRLETRWGDAWVYVAKGDTSELEEIESGQWRDWVRRRIDNSESGPVLRRS